MSAFSYVDLVIYIERGLLILLILWAIAETYLDKSLGILGVFSMFFLSVSSVSVLEELGSIHSTVDNTSFLFKHPIFIFSIVLTCYVKTFRSKCWFSGWEALKEKMRNIIKLD